MKIDNIKNTVFCIQLWFCDKSFPSYES